LPLLTQLTADLPTEDYSSHPFHLLDCKPDHIVWNTTIREVHFIELTVCFDTWQLSILIS
jgi:hypothetical protein